MRHNALIRLLRGEERGLIDLGSPLGVFRFARARVTNARTHSKSISSRDTLQIAKSVTWFSEIVPIQPVSSVVTDADVLAA